MNKFNEYITALQERVTLATARTFSAEKNNQKIKIDARSDGGITVTLNADGKFTTYTFDSTELRELEAWLKKND